jgi:hypothetical protein
MGRTERVRRRPHTPSLLAAILGALVAVAIASGAANAKAPSGIFGVVYGPPGSSLPYAGVAADTQLMASSGVESARVDFPWVAVEPQPGQLHWEVLDPVVAAAAAQGIDLLPVVIASPRWASSGPGRVDFAFHAPRDPETYGRFLQALIGRYGPNGSFWAENPALPKLPIRRWQIWNEPSARYFWATPNYRRSYPRLLKVAYRAVHRADPGAQVVMAGLASFLQRTGRKTTSWEDLLALYRNGVSRYFDVLAIHPFSRSLERVVRTIRLNRNVMRQSGDRHKPIYLTELSWPASKGQIPRNRLLGFEVSAARQRKLLTSAYRRFARDRKLGVKRVYWYSWSTPYSPVSCGGTQPSFQYVGLVQTPCGGFASTPTPLLSTYASTARSL